VTAHDEPGGPLQFDRLEVVLGHPSISYLRSISEKVPIFHLIACWVIDTPLFIRRTRVSGDVSGFFSR
jgi:hypothetical protein